MAIALTTAERVDLGKFLEAHGQKLDIIDRRAPRAQWWRGDGKPLGSLPADGYHVRLYMNKGFLMSDPGTWEPPERESGFTAFLGQQKVVAEPTPILAIVDDKVLEYTHSCGWTPRPDSKNFSSSLRFHARSCDKESVDG